MTSQYELVIIGFGVSGVAMARAAQKKGIKYIVLEASSNCGGVWNNAFDTSRLQTHWKNYRFSDYYKKYVLSSEIEDVIFWCHETKREQPYV